MSTDLPTRRSFLQMASVAAFVAGARYRAPSQPLPALDCYPHMGDPVLKELAAHALDAARGAGATYADVRFTLTRQIYAGFSSPAPGHYGVSEQEEAAVGVRAFRDGAWGFASGPLWSRPEMVRLGQLAADAARVHAAGRQQKIELGERPPAITGEWVMPVAIDPCTVPTIEKLDVLAGIWDAASRLFPKESGVGGGVKVEYRRQEKTFASTDGSFLSQTLYTAHPSMGLGASPPWRPWTTRTFDRLQPCARGWELMMDGTLARDLEQVAEEALLQLTAERINPGRYDVVCDAYTVGQLLGRTVGMATELDRVLGYEANQGGTSYLAPPEDILGTYNFGTPLLNVRANRSRPEALATVKWDDDGIAPDEYAVIQDGIVVDYHTTRDLVAPLTPWYSKRGRPLRSHGCASAQSASAVTLLQPPNLEMTPSARETSFEELVAGLENGLVIMGGTFPPTEPGFYGLMRDGPVTVDRQQLNGEIDPNFAYEVKNGKRTRVVYGVECLFRSPELWKSLQAIGGPASQRTTGCFLAKGQPFQQLRYGVTTGPARFKQMAVTDRWRKA